MGKNRNCGATSFNHFAKQIEVTATTIIKIQPQTLTQVLLCCCDFITSSWPRSELSIKEIFIFKTTSCLCKLIGFWEGCIRVVNISIDSLLVVLVGHLTRTWHSQNAELPANVSAFHAPDISFSRFLFHFLLLRCTSATWAFESSNFVVTDEMHVIVRSFQGPWYMFG